jgi:hypothetical protein
MEEVDAQVSDTHTLLDRMISVILMDVFSCDW